MTPKTCFSVNSVNRSFTRWIRVQYWERDQTEAVGFVVKQLKPFQGKVWCVISYVDGKRKLKWFASEENAREYADVQNRDRDDYGSKITLTAEQRLL
jgi:hypothetical protein